MALNQIVTANRIVPAGLVVVALLLAAMCSGPLISGEGRAAAADKAADVKVATGEYRITGPYTVKNLSVFLVQGSDTLKDKEFLTLGEALENRKIVVEETGTVNELVINNKGNVTVYILGGEIVKGGKQDRVLKHDLIVPPGKKLSVTAFCVEQGRWSARGGESAGSFNSSENILSSRSQKLAARVSGDQGQVWENVARSQERLGKSTGGSVQSEQSKTSLELTLRDKKVTQGIDEYVKELSGVMEGKKDVVGYGYVINGQVNTVDIYGSAALFKKLWPKLLKSAAVEALENYQADKTFASGTTDDIRKFMLDAEQAQRVKEKVSDRVTLEKGDSKNAVILESKDMDNAAAPMRKSYIAK